MSEPTCALWYWRHFQVYAELFVSEREAASAALAMEDEGAGSVKGVQLSDGRFIERDNWPEYEAEERRQQEAWKNRSRNTEPQPQPNRVTPPFDARGQQAYVYDAVPPWLEAGAVRREGE